MDSARISERDILEKWWAQRAEIFLCHNKKELDLLWWELGICKADTPWDSNLSNILNHCTVRAWCYKGLYKLFFRYETVSSNSNVYTGEVYSHYRPVRWKVYLNFAGENTPIQSVSLAPTGFLYLTVTNSAVSPCQPQKLIIGIMCQSIPL